MKTKKRKRESEKIREYREKIEEEVEKLGYIYGTENQLSKLLKIPIKTFRKITNENFSKSVIKEGRRKYLMITKKK